MEDPLVNPLLSTQKSTDSSTHVALHPLPILEISDYITRASLRGQDGPIIGALLGQQTGREATVITIEHSFSCRVTKNEDGLKTMDLVWFKDRLAQLMLVHKEPQLDLVGWYTLVPKSGPTHDHLLIHTLLRELYNESLVLLGFHTEDILHPNPRNPLPITIYECNPEVEDSGKEDQTEGEDKEMKDPEHTTRRSLKFRDLPFTTETGDAEMIAMQFIRQGGANATVEGSTATADASKTRLPGLRDLIGGKPATKPDSKGKQPAVAQEKGKKAEAEAKASNGASLSKEDVELISALQAKSNAIKMMRDRLQLVISYLDKLPAEPFAASQTLANAPAGQGIAPSHNILRQIQALVINLELVTPTQQDALQKEMLQQSNDVTLITMVKDLLSSVTEVREVGKKFAVVESARSQKMRRPFGDAGSQALSVGDAGDISFS